MSIVPVGDILDFWFLPEGDPLHDKSRAEWFRKSDTFDALIAQQFGGSVESALSGLLPAPGGPDAMLAGILLLDQFTRNMFRDTPRAFAGDALALAMAKGLIDAGFDRSLSPMRRCFVYMPFMHAEELPQQEKCVALFAALRQEEGDAFANNLDYAIRHRDVIARFGRFPHRNGILGRSSSDAELEFLSQPGSSF